MSPPPRPARGGRLGGDIDRWQLSGLSAQGLDLRRLLLSEICKGRGGGGSGRRAEKAFGQTLSKMWRVLAFSVVTLCNDKKQRKKLQQKKKIVEEPEDTTLARYAHIFSLQWRII